MRSESVYEVECLCGRVFQTTSGNQFSCPTCGRILIVVLREPVSVPSPAKKEQQLCRTPATTTN